MYKIQYTERNNKKANEYETRSLLYLLSIHQDRDEITIFFIDCMNDLTGSNDDCSKLWDTQAKGVSSLNPTKIGTSLITLYQNYVSELEINEYVLLIPKLNEGYLIDESLLEFGFSNFKESKRSYLLNGIRNEFKNRTETTISESQLNSFIEKISFVVGENKDKYVKEITQFKNKDSHPVQFYEKIFDEIRDQQSALKNICIEGVEISHPSDLLIHNKHLKSSDVKLMVLNRFIGTELFKGHYIPNSYFDEITHLEYQDRLDQLQENNERISRTFFNKNNKKSFWLLLENIMENLSQNRTDTAREIFEKLNPRLVSENYTMNEQSVIFFIALIKDGINDQD